MDLWTAINTRQSVSKVRPDPVPPEMIQTLLAAAAQAPNHFRVRPWRFVVVQGAARARMGAVLAQCLLRRQPDAGANALEVERARPLRAPVLIAVGVDKPAEPKVIEVENICAAAAAVQNMLLAACALGLGAMWRTGPAAYEPAVKDFLGFAPDQHLIGFIYIGWPEKELEPPQRPSYEDRTVWMES